MTANPIGERAPWQGSSVSMHRRVPDGERGIMSQIRRRGAPVSLVALLAFMSGLAPYRSAAAAEGVAPEPSEQASHLTSTVPADEAPATSAEELSAADRPQAQERKLTDAIADTAQPADGQPHPAEYSAAANNLVAVPSDQAHPMSLVSGENKSGVSAQAISVPKGPGTIQGMGESFSAQASTGIATFTVPIALPAARGAVQASLALAYSSSSGNGVAGIGWDVGVPFIARQTDRGLPSYDDQGQWHATQDRFVYNGGQELVPVSALAEGEVLPAWAGAGWQYFRPRVEGSYLRFFWNPQDKLWRVQDKTGVVLELGAVGGQTDALESDPSHPEHVFRWNLKRSVDAHGNEVRYSYTHDGNLAYLSDIYDTPLASGSAPGITASWAHHTRLVYDPRADVTHAFTRGWETTRALRLAHIDVTSKGDDALQPRALLRRYHLSYLAGLHASLLESVQVEGRCAQDVLENSGGALGPTSCPRLPAMKLGYTHVASDAQGVPTLIDGFERVDTAVRPIASSPDYSVDDTYTDLYDINSDGLPDVVQTRSIAALGSKHGVWFQGAQGLADRFTGQLPMGVVGVNGVTAGSLSKSSPVVAALDLDGDATIDLVHMPQETKYTVFTPRGSGQAYNWVGRSVSTTDGLDARIDLSNDAELLRVFDINGDGLVDVMKTGESYQVWFALGRYPGGDGLFGNASWTGANAAQLSMAPVLRCVPWSSGSVVFGPSEIKLADMNGDGLTDIVRVRSSDTRYWPGRGDGTFGTGPLGCQGGTHSENSYVLMSDSPDYSAPSADMVRLDDVNGDGTADMIQIRTDEVDVWYNVDGTSWQQRRLITNTPDSANYGRRVRLADMNGSGTTDLVWAVGLGYKYVDLAGGRRPWLLNRVENGLGKTTDVEYTTSTAAMLAAERAGRPWATKSPVVLQMVERVTVRDNLGTVGRPDGVYVTDYTYRDPYYDGIQREFRGFASTKVRTFGDANSPTSEAETSFLLGASPSDFDPKDRWKDNPNEALKGLPTVVQTYAVDSNGKPTTYLSTGATTYVLRKLYDGKDGRAVRAAFARQTDTWLYDTSVPMSAGAAVAVPWLDAQDNVLAGVAGDEVIAPSPVLQAQSGRKHIASAVRVDAFGNRTVEVAFGEVGVDPAIGTFTVAERKSQAAHVLGEGNWAWRTTSAWAQQVRIGMQDPVYERRGETSTEYNPFAEPYKTSAKLVSPGMLVRAAIGAPAPDNASAGGWFETGTTHYDVFGNAAFTAGPNGRCSEVVYDSDYAQLPMAETTYVGTVGTAHQVDGDEHDCGGHGLTTHAKYDRVLGAITEVRGFNDELSKVVYDGLGRIKEMYRPHPNSALEVTPVPALKVEYHLPDETGRPVSRLVSHTQDGATDNDADYHVTYAYIDGMGRTVVTLSEADPEEDEHPWIAQGLTDYDLKGAERRKYLAWWYDGDPLQYDLSEPAKARYGQQRYDAFGRAIETTGLDGTVTLKTKYHALSADAWDAEDLGPGEHFGTYASEQKDGHGRVVRTTERVRAGNTIEQRHVDSTYLVTGEVVSIMRRRGGESYERTMLYDSLGRMTVNLEPSALGDGRGWRYVYSDAGDLVGTSDPRGCGENYAYDAAGRLLTEDYSPCIDGVHDDYDEEPEVVYEYDGTTADQDEAFAPAATWSAQDLGDFDCRDGRFNEGRLVAVIDRSGMSVTCVDGRGRGIESARRVVSPSGGLTDTWYRQRQRHDGADRVTIESTGASVGLPAGQTTTITTSYTARGTVESVSSTYGDLVTRIRRDPDGLVDEIVYGDAAATTTGFTYDDLRRLRNLTTYRARADLWPQTGTGTQQLLLQDEQYTYDRVGNPTEIRDWRIASEWDAGAKPVTRKLKYDDLYRLSKIEYQYPQGSDGWVDPFAAEVSDINRPQPSPRADFTGAKRPLWQTYAYDWLGNTVSTDDDAHAFYDRSLGTVANTGYQLTGAKNTAKGGTHTGDLSAQYDGAGNLVALNVHRNGACIPANSCTDQHFEYEWDEVGRLVRARRFDMENPPSGVPPNAELRYVYDASDSRVIKTVGSRHTVYLSGSLELRLAQYDEDANDYEVTNETESVYLLANGVRLARVVHDVDDPYELASTRVFLELGDQLGSTSVVLDLASGELVERSTAYAYGATESDYRPERWGKFREDYRFTGKEEDIEVGLQYFGKRFYAPLLQRWVSADPLAVHAPGQADLNLYAYVHGRVLVAVDPVGLDYTEMIDGNTITICSYFRVTTREAAEKLQAAWRTHYNDQWQVVRDATTYQVRFQLVTQIVEELPPKYKTGINTLTIGSMEAHNKQGQNKLAGAVGAAGTVYGRNVSVATTNKDKLFMISHEIGETMALPHRETPRWQGILSLYGAGKKQAADAAVQGMVAALRQGRLHPNVMEPSAVFPEWDENKKLAQDHIERLVDRALNAQKGAVRANEVEARSAPNASDRNAAERRAIDAQQHFTRDVVADDYPTGN